MHNQFNKHGFFDKINGRENKNRKMKITQQFIFTNLHEKKKNSEYEKQST